MSTPELRPCPCCGRQCFGNAYTVWCGGVFEGDDGTRRIGECPGGYETSRAAHELLSKIATAARVAGLREALEFALREISEGVFMGEDAGGFDQWLVNDKEGLLEDVARSVNRRIAELEGGKG